MNYPESQLILKEIKKSKNILVNCHRGPDPDSVGSALALFRVLKSLDKNVNIICTDPIEDNVKYLKDSGVVEKIDYTSFNFSEWDLFITLDSSSIDQVTGSKESKLAIPLVVIDHHTSNTRYGFINLVDDIKISTAEILYLVFKDWDVEIDFDTAEALLTGIISDSGVFRFPAVTTQTLEISLDLIKMGVDKNKIIFNLFSSIPYDRLLIWGYLLANLKYDVENKFYWSAMPYEKLTQFKDFKGSRETLATMLSGSMANSDFSLLMTEELKNRLSVSFRGRTGVVDVSKMAVEIGGGGHKVAAAGKIENTPFDQAVETVLAVCRKHANKG